MKEHREQPRSMDVEKRLQEVEEFLRTHGDSPEEAVVLLKGLYEVCLYLKDQADIDFLTGLYNRRAFDRQLELNVERARRERSIFSLILLDIDHFKRINDVYGHLAGDDVLRRLAQIIKLMTRRGDFPARYGGEEFAILLPGTGFEGALSVAWRLKQQITETEFKVEGTSLKITVSMGLGTYRPLSGLSSREFLDRVDQLLYAAKNRGRNLIVHEEKLVREETDGLSQEEKLALLGGVSFYDD